MLAATDFHRFQTAACAALFGAQPRRRREHACQAFARLIVSESLLRSWLFVWLI